MKKNIFIKLSQVILVIYLFMVPILVFAEGDVPAPLDSSSGGKILNPLASKNIDSLTGLIKTLLEGVLKVGMPIIALAIIYSGFLFVAARGNPEKLTKAKEALLYTLIGAAILLGSWAIAELISSTVLAL